MITTPDTNQDFAQLPNRTPLKIGVGIFIVLGVLLATWWYTQRPSGNPTAPKSPVMGSIKLLDPSKSDSVSELPALTNLQDPPTTQLAIQTTNTTFSLNQQGRAEITLQSKDSDQVIDGIELVVRFDPEILSGVSLQPSTTFKSVVRNEVSQENGTIRLMLVRQPNEAITIPTTTTLGTLVFTPKKTGITKLSFDSEGTVVAGNNGADILESTEDLSIEIQ